MDVESQIFDNRTVLMLKKAFFNGKFAPRRPSQ